jgi:plasmid stabilization system protein ParE
MGRGEGLPETRIVTSNVVLRPEAVADLLAARQWYEGQRRGLGGEFLDSVDELLDQIGKSPEIHAAEIKDVRRGKVRKFPYVAYYRILTDRVEVLGVLHGNRDPRSWQKRT